MHDLYTNNYKALLTLKPEVLEDVNRLRDTPRSWSGGLNVVTTAGLPELIYKFSALPIKSSQHLTLTT